MCCVRARLDPHPLLRDADAYRAPIVVVVLPLDQSGPHQQLNGGGHCGGRYGKTGREFVHGARTMTGKKA